MELKRGYEREDGMIFLGYRKREGGFKRKQWVTTDDIIRIREQQVLYRAANPESPEARKIRVDKWKRNNPEKVKAQQRKRAAKIYAADPEKARAKNAAYRDKNREKLREYARRYSTEGRGKSQLPYSELNPMRRLKILARNKVRLAIKKVSGKKGRTISHIGCSWDSLKIHLENQFQPGMTWDNYGARGWHVDHRVPLASAKTFEELLPLLRFENLQPLWAIDNLRKGSKIL